MLFIILHLFILLIYCFSNITMDNNTRMMAAIPIPCIDKLISNDSPPCEFIIIFYPFCNFQFIYITYFNINDSNLQIIIHELRIPFHRKRRD